MISDIYKIFLYPIFFCFLPFPLLISALFRPKNYEKPLKLPIYDDFKKISYRLFGISRPSFRLKHLLMWLSWGLLLIAMARPQYLFKVNDIRVTGRDLLLDVDMSGSMSRDDIMNKNGKKITRFEAVKTVVSEFLSKRTGDRVGLAVFGGTAHLYAPLTFDGNAISAMLNELEVEMVDPNTAIGDGIAVGVKHLASKNDSKNKVIILLTDGENNAGSFKPEEAARLAKNLGIKIYTIGFIGTSNQAVDEASLIRIANGTGGEYYRATNRPQLESIYKEIDALEPSFSDASSYIYVDVFYIPLFLCFMCLTLAFAMYGLKK